jgi:hypothetical protein
VKKSIKDQVKAGGSDKFIKAKKRQFSVCKGADNFSINRNTHAKNSSSHAKTRNPINGVIFSLCDFSKKQKPFSEGIA